MSANQQLRKVLQEIYNLVIAGEVKHTPPQAGGIWTWPDRADEALAQPVQHSGLHLACPFCAGQVDPQGWLGEGGVRGPECDDCGATATDMQTWNQRAGAVGSAHGPINDDTIDRIEQEVGFGHLAWDTVDPIQLVRAVLKHTSKHPTESVLIDGKAYTIPAEVAVELVRLHMELLSGVALRKENELLRIALRFYANGEHYITDESEGFDTVSGEPQNWLCSGVEDSQTMIEDGEVARHTLMGQVIGWEDAEDDHTPKPIEGEAPFSAAALQSSDAIPQQQAGAVALTDGQELWLWQNGDHMLAFQHLYPCVTPGGDPMTLGEPYARAVFRASHARARSV